MQFLFIKDSKNGYIATPAFAHFNSYTRDIYDTSSMFLDREKNKFVWAKRYPEDSRTDLNGNLFPKMRFLSDNYTGYDINHDYKWISSEDIPHGIHCRDVVEEYFRGMSVNNDADFDKVLQITESIPQSVIDECAKICEKYPFPEWHKIVNNSDFQDLFIITWYFETAEFTDVTIEDEKIVLKLYSEEEEYEVELVFEGNVSASESFLKEPLKTWDLFAFLISDGKIYLLDDDTIDYADEIQPSTNYICGEIVNYKIKPFV